MYSAAIREVKRIPVASQLAAKIRVSSSPVEGKGLFAAADIHPGERLFLITGEFVSHSYSPDFSAQGRDWIGATANKWLKPDEDNLIVYLNHSCSPNCYINEEFAVVAMHAVKEGEELFMDYSTTEIDPYWQLDCTCRSPKCRKQIKAFQHLPRMQQVSYLKYIPMRLFNFIPKVS
jgi:uncharacterized protein